MALSYIGGKSRIGKWIVTHYPKDIETYVEPFGGMFWCFFNMNLKSFPQLNKVVYNDFNPLNYNLFCCLQNPEQLLYSLNQIPCQQKGISQTPSEYRELFDSFQSELFAQDLEIVNPDYEKAAKYVYILTQVFSGSKPETSSYIDLKGKYKSKFLTFRDKLSNPNWLEKFFKITHVENLDFELLIQKYDAPNTYFYLDPPYWKTENYYSNHDFDRQDHERLKNSILGIEGKFGLSYYDFDLLHEWFPQEQFNWKKQTFKKAAAASKGKKQNSSEEIGRAHV